MLTCADLAERRCCVRWRVTGSYCLSLFCSAFSSAHPPTRAAARLVLLSRAHSARHVSLSLLSWHCSSFAALLPLSLSLSLSLPLSLSLSLSLCSRALLVAPCCLAARNGFRDAPIPNLGLETISAAGATRPLRGSFSTGLLLGTKQCPPPQPQRLNGCPHRSVTRSRSIEGLPKSSGFLQIP